MGATNVLRAYLAFAGKIPPLSMQVLAYMAAVSRDVDEEPWYSQGQEALAEFALGRERPIERADIAAVERALKPLFDEKAITTDRPSARRRDGPWTARYRLHLGHAQPVDIRRAKAQGPG